jgi:pimeloyl-ACP methyl ester carboxylesterase
VERRTQYIDNGHGWRLALHRFVEPARLKRGGRPLVIVPGFAMNSFIFSYHPRGVSLVEYLAGRGHEVWTVDLRAQGETERRGGHFRFGLVDVGLHDVSVALAGVLRHSTLGASAVDAVGCSLGGTFLFMQAAWNPEAPIARLVNVGGPLRWERTHPVVRALASYPPLYRALRLRGTRRMACRVLPLAARIPGALHPYLHPAICDLSSPEMLCRTVEDPVPRVNEQIARWIRDRDLLDAGRNLTDGARAIRLPLLTIVANADGVVPPETARSGHEVVASARRHLVTAGDAHHPMAHGDLFVSDLAEASVFRPLADWLEERD